MRALHAYVHAYDKRRVRLAHIIIHTPRMFLHIVHHKDFCYAQRTTSSPRGTIINAHPVAHSLGDDHADCENDLDSPVAGISLCVHNVSKGTWYFPRLIHGPMDDREAGRGEREKGALLPFTSR